MSAQKPAQPIAQLEIINVKNIEDFEKQVWEAVNGNDIPGSEMYFILQRISHMILDDSYKRTEDDEN